MVLLTSRTDLLFEIILILLVPSIYGIILFIPKLQSQFAEFLNTIYF